MRPDPTVLAYYFPNWHVDPRNEQWHGPGWTEWEVMKYARPRFEGHRQPRVPLWGYEDESDPAVMAKKIDAAVTHGIDGFIWDWYWFNDGGYRLRALDEGFLGAPNCDRAKFGIMWCNHDPVWVHPQGVHTGWQPLMSGDLTVQGFYEGTQHCIEHYFPRPNYLRTAAGKIWFCIYSMGKFVGNMGGVQGARIVLEDFRARVRAAGLGELDLCSVAESIPGFSGGDTAKANAMIAGLGIDSLISHACVNIKEDESLPFPHRPYSAMMDATRRMFTDFTARSPVPYSLNVREGHDHSARTIPSESFGNYGGNFQRIVNDNTPALVEQILREAKTFHQEKGTGEFITIYSWNEWTEGGYLEPDTEYGYGWLDAVKNVFGER